MPDAFESFFILPCPFGVITKKNDKCSFNLDSCKPRTSNSNNDKYDRDIGDDVEFFALFVCCSNFICTTRRHINIQKAEKPKPFGLTFWFVRARVSRNN